MSELIEPSWEYQAPARPWSGRQKKSDFSADINDNEASPVQNPSSERPTAVLRTVATTRRP